MTARQQLARLLPLVLLVVLVIAGLGGVVPRPRWNGPFTEYGTAIGIALEVVFCALLLVVGHRDAAARRAAWQRPYTGADIEIQPPEALRFTLRYVLGMCMLAVGVALIANLHFHFFIKLRPPKPPKPPKLRNHPKAGHASTWLPHIPVAAVGYGLLVVALVAAIVISIWWSSRLRRPAAPLVMADVDTGELREAVESGRAALARIDDARAAIIACYVAMERTLADRGTARGMAETPDELLARAVATGVVRGAAASRLTAAFYEARFSTHPISARQRDAAGAALDELAGELAAQAASQQAAASQGAGQAVRPGGGWV